MKKVFITFITLCLVTAGVVSQDQTHAAEELDRPIECNGDQIEYFEAEKKIVGVGNIEVKYKDMILTCDKVTVWTQTKEAEAEGNVVITEGEDVYKGDYIKYNLGDYKGSIINAKANVGDWYIKSKDGERVNKEKFIMRKSQFTTCERDRPHWRLTTNRLLVYPGVKVTAVNAIVWIDGVPVMWIPYYSHPLDDDRPHVTLIPGRSDAWGNYLLTAWRYNLSPNQKGYVHLDYRERKDFASGIDYAYKSEYLGEGTVKTYYMNERDLKRDHAWDKWRDNKENNDQGVTEELEKGLLRIRHKWDLAPEISMTAEMHKYKDEDLLEDYFFNEYTKDERPESYVLLTETFSYGSLSILTKKRANRFDTVVELLPEATLDIYSTRLSDSNLYYSSNFSAANLNQKYARGTDESPTEGPYDKTNNRLDTYNQFSYKTKLGFLNVTPYAGTRQTYFDREISDDNSRIRGAFLTGVDVSTKFYKVFHTQASPFGMEINNLMHIITPTTSYNYTSLPTLRSEKLFQFDDIDALDRGNSLTFGLENKLQTKRGEELQTKDIAMLLVETSYDFSHSSEGRQMGDYTATLELLPFDWLTMTSDVVIDSHRRYDHEYLREANNDISINFPDKWKLGMGHRYTHDAQSVMFHGELETIPGWKIRVWEDLDIKRHRQGGKKIYDLREQEYAITRDLHCWEMDLVYNVERDKGETFMLIFRLKAFPDMPLEYGREYHQPKRGSQSYGGL